ncbi:MAG: ABC1 kinase family protein [Bradymonadaceae bacterium]
MVSPVQTAVQDIRRLREISSVLTRHGFDAFARSAGLERFLDNGTEGRLEEDDEGVDRPEELIESEDQEDDPAVRFRNVLEDLGPTFVKFGQILSTRPDILPPEFIEELKKLQDRVPPMERDDVEEQIEANLDGEIDDHFDWIDDEPLAAASIAQVHRARTDDGRECVLKVQRLGIREQIQSDLDILYYLARFLEATIEELELYTPTAIVEEFEEAILSELDFEREAKNIRTFGANFEDEPRVGVPDVLEDRSTEQLLALEYVEGEKLSDVEGGTERAGELLDALLDAMVQMVLYDGFFHGDPHPGNVLVDREDRLIFIDFGLVGSLSPRQQDDIIDLILTVLTGDEDGIARTLLKMGYPVGRVNLREFKADIVEIRDKYLFSTLAEVQVSEFVQETMDAAQRHQIRLNPEYARLTKAAMTIEGIMRRLEPDLDIMEKGKPYARQLAAHRYSAKNILEGMVTSATGLSTFVQQVPQHLDQILMDLESGNLGITVENESLDNLESSLNTLGTRLFLGLIASSMIVSSTMILSQYDYHIQGVSVMFVLGVLLALTALLFFWWALGWHLFGSSGSGKISLAPLLRLWRRE